MKSGILKREVHIMMRGQKVYWCCALVLIAAMVVAGCAPAEPEEPTATKEPSTETASSDPTEEKAASILETVKERGKLNCGVNGQLPGFSYVTPDGTYSGFDVDYCRAVAAAVLGDPDAVEYRNLSTQERFTALQSGEIDVLIRNTTWTISRDTSVGGEFAPTTFYDGQGMMVRKDSGITSLEDMDGADICVLSGTTNELNLADQMRKRGVSFTAVNFEDTDAIYQAYDEGRCDGVTSDRSQLIARRTTLSNPDDHVILDVVMSKEPLGPLTIDGDSQWADIVQWIVFATFQAEEFGIRSDNVDEFMDTDDPGIRRFLGIEGDLGVGLGLSNDFALRVIEAVGNYAEIYDRNLGPDTPFDLARGPNLLWTDGGLLYSPPFR